MITESSPQLPVDNRSELGVDSQENLPENPSPWKTLTATS